MNRIYAGIGSRRTPSEIQTRMTIVAVILATRGWILRSGGASGADTAFELGVNVYIDMTKDAVKNVSVMAKEIFYETDITNSTTSNKALDLAKKYHPAWESMGRYAKRLHGRNSFQILGRSLDSPVDFVVCWTPDGCTDHSKRSIKTGGTGTAISIASSLAIPVWNLSLPSHLSIFDSLISLAVDDKSIDSIIHQLTGGKNG